ncbi:LysR family transcriptional regulator [Tsukamurella sp. 8F]|uniref:LysR family transcriptional regulator n=1 Tax=unclassified Tsukamurella TaxID=2633480 RepID=UPI0023B9C342|nr:MULTISPECIES: LysR family transcriptional regulator [unclassified Tsukamurella]MDF0529365.1 LysR family transcriptional regulator [Tsukamurella sp. 8J]MDF0587128.1 LysR family transcriptional regulator [Tsukamurella sp. 8F]
MDDLRRVRYFETLVQHRHFGAAAAALHITQPALSQQIKKLERELGAPLIDRDRPGFALTMAGEHLANHAPDLLRVADQLAEAVRDHATGTRGEIRIALTRSGADAGIAPRIRRFREEHPRVRITSITGWTAWNLEMLRAGEVDVAFVRGTISASDIDVIPCGTEEVAAILPLGHRLAARATVAAADLQHEPVVFWPRTTGPDYYDEVIGAIWPDAPPNIVAEEADAEQVLEQVARGVGISALDRTRSTRIAPAGVVVVPLTSPPSVAIGLASRREESAPAVVELLGWWTTRKARPMQDL